MKGENALPFSRGRKHTVWAISVGNVREIVLSRESEQANGRTHHMYEEEYPSVRRRSVIHNLQQRASSTMLGTLQNRSVSVLPAVSWLATTVAKNGGFLGNPGAVRYEADLRVTGKTSYLIITIVINRS